jgi:hypothetical protein
MADPKRVDLRTAADASRAGDRDAVAAQIESLLVEGLDRYFAHQYDEAIHVWTRVLFLDRAHARARAYIDRARTALAERHRRGDELLQASQELLERGAVAAARAKLHEAVALGGDDERASALWLKVERRERTRATASIGPEPAETGRVSTPGWRDPARLLAAAAILMAVAVAGGLAAVASWEWLRPGPSLDTAGRAVGPAAPVVLSSADVALVRARTLYAHGRLAEALQALDRVPPSTPSRPEADALRRDIQRLLLATAQPRPHQNQGPTP